jgi:glycosyltransferase 2 family protein
LKKKLFSAAKLLFFLGIGAFFIWLFVGHLEDKEKIEIMESFRQAKYGWIILVLFISIFSHILRTFRWQMLLSPLGFRARFWNVFMATMIGYFANLALPRLGEVTRCSVLTKYENIPFQKSLGTVVAERAFDVLTFLVLFFVNLLIQYDRLHQYVNEEIYIPLTEKFSFIGKGYILYGSIFMVFLFIALFFFYRKRLRKIKLYQKAMSIIRGFADGLKSLLKLKNPGLFLLYTVLIWTMYFFMTYLCFFSIQQTTHIGPMAGFSVLVFGTIGIMVVQGGIGIYPTLVAGTLVLYEGLQIKNHAYALGWLIWTAQTASIIVAGIVSLILLPLYNKSQNGKNKYPETEIAQS